MWSYLYKVAVFIFSFREPEKPRPTSMWSAQDCTSAAERGDLPMLKWLHSRNCPWDATTCAGAAKAGRLDVLQWLRARGCPWDERTCSYSLARNHIRVFRWARENGCKHNP